MLGYSFVPPESPGQPKTDLARMMSHYGVNEAEAIQLMRQGQPLPPRGTGLQREGLAGFVDDIQEHWGFILIISALTYWIFTRK